jgi:hypothetical protein
MKLFTFALLISMTISFTSCSNISTSDVATGIGASGAAALMGVVTSNPMLIAAGTAGGALAGGTVVADPQITVADYGGADGQINSFYELMSFAIANFMQHMVALVVGVTFIWFLTGYLGMRKRRPEEKQLEKQSMMLIEKIAKMKDSD